MIVYVGIKAVDEPYFGGMSASLEAQVFRHEDDAKKYGHLVLPVEHTLLPKYQIYLDMKSNGRKEYEKWYAENAEWANQIVPYLYDWGINGLKTPDEMYPKRGK